MNQKTVFWLLGGGLMVALLFYFGAFDKVTEAYNSEGGDEQLPPPEPAPNFSQGTGGYGPTTGIGAGVNPVQNQPMYFIDEGPGKDAVEGRMRTIYNNKQALQRVIRENGILTSAYGNLQYPQGMQQVIVSTFGTRDGVTVTPPTVDGGAYIEQLESLKALDNFNTLEAGGKMEFAKTVYRNASMLPDGQSLIPGNIQMFLDNGLFGPGSRADKNGSNLWDRYGEDLKAFASNLVNAALDLDNVLRMQAVEDLQGAGWSFANA